MPAITDSNIQTLLAPTPDVLQDDACAFAEIHAVRPNAPGPKMLSCVARLGGDFGLRPAMEVVLRSDD